MLAFFPIDLASALKLLRLCTLSNVLFHCVYLLGDFSDSEVMIIKSFGFLC